MNIRTRNILEHMLDDALDIIKFTDEIDDVEAFSSNRLYRKAVVMSILNIGELAKNLPQDFKIAYNEIPWKKIAGMRDFAAHGYHVMDDDIIWDVAKNSMPDLVNFIKEKLKTDSPLRKEST
ncbi:MAG: DUF86 domain-containing protein [Oscillospiraceae bacterium]|nr:DUF86 domain-containing protein [Oscillospiraceae bacterium]